MSSMVLSVHCKADHSVEMLASLSEAQEYWDTVQQEPSGLPRHVDGVVAGSLLFCVVATCSVRAMLQR